MTGSSRRRSRRRPHTRLSSTSATSWRADCASTTCRSSARCRSRMGYARELADVRRRADEFLERCLAEVAAWEPSVVGFTSMFHQTAASLALAERVKAVLPETFVVFGGASCRGETGSELLRRFRFVDAVATGEGEAVLPELVRRMRARAAARWHRRSPDGPAPRGRRAAARGARGRPPSRRPRLVAAARLRRLLRALGQRRPERDLHAPSAVRDLTRLLVGREASLRLLRPGERQSDVSAQERRAQPDGARGARSPPSRVARDRDRRDRIAPRLPRLLPAGAGSRPRPPGPLPRGAARPEQGSVAPARPGRGASAGGRRGEPQHVGAQADAQGHHRPPGSGAAQVGPRVGYRGGLELPVGPAGGGCRPSTSGWRD